MMNHVAEPPKVDSEINLLTFLGKSPNAVAAKYPALIEPENEKRKIRVSAIVITSAITE